MNDMTAPSQRFTSAWAAYQSALHELYSAPAQAGAQTERGDEAVHAERLGEQAGSLLARSAEVRAVLLDSLSQPELEQRELAALKLIAAAACDLSVGADLAQWTGPEAGAERTARGAFLASDDLRAILDAPLDAGMRALVEPERSVLPSEPMAARALLETTIADFLKHIPREASSPARAAVVGLLGLGIVPGSDWLSVGAQEIAGRAAGGLAPLLQAAAGLVGEAILKLQSALTPTGGELLKELPKFFSELQNAKDAMTAAIEKIYQVPRIHAETTTLVRGAAPGTATERYNLGTQKLEELTISYSKTAGALEQFVRLMGLAKLPLLAAPPWGPIAVYVCSLSVLGYAIYSGGEYVDWYLTRDREWLQRVEGLRHTVRKALSADAPFTP